MAATRLIDSDGNTNDSPWEMYQPPQQQGQMNDMPNADGSGGFGGFPAGGPGPMSGGGGSADVGGGGVLNIQRQPNINDIFSKYGLKPGETDAANLAAKKPEDVAQYLRDLEAQAKRRAAPTDGRLYDSQSAQGNALYGSGTGNNSNTPAGNFKPGVPASQSVPGQFSDPISSFLEQFAQQRAQQRENPPGGSGQALLEEALKSIASQLQGGGYTPAEKEVFQTQAMDPLEQLRSARKQQVMQSLSARGITPNSGVALQMIADVDRQFDAQRAMTQRSIASQGAEETTNRMMQAVQLLSALSGTENARLNEAFQYRGVPLNLADRAFGQAMQTYNAAGNPLTLAQPLMSLAGMQNNRSDNMQEMLGYLAAILANRS